MKKYLVIVVAVMLLTACQSCNPALVPVTTGYGVPTITLNGKTLCLEDNAFVNADLTALLDSLKKGYTIKTGGLEVWIRQDSIGHIGVNAKMCVDIQ